MTTTSRSRPTTPIRRLSQGSLASSARRASASRGSGNGGKDGRSARYGPESPLGFLTQAMGDLAYETATLQANLESIDEIQDALHTFDESFSMFLYGLRMNAFCVEWPEAPREDNFQRAERRQVHEEKMQSRPSDTPKTVRTLPTVPATPGGDQTYMTQYDEEDLIPTSSRTRDLHTQSARPSALRAKSASSTAGRTALPQKGRITAAERKRREAMAAPIIDTMPLEYRGSDPVQQQLALKVILALIAAGSEGIRLNAIARSPELPQAKVNKCLIALVAAKHVIKRSDNGVVYQLDPSRHAL